MPGNSQAPNVIGNNSYHYICWNGSLEIVELFLEHHTLNSGDAKVKGFDMQNSEGDTPLHYATRNGHLRIVVALLNQGADYTIQNNEKETPIDCLLKKHGSQELSNLAIQKDFPKLVELLKTIIIKGNILYRILQDYDHNKNQLTDDEYLIGEYTESIFEKNRDLFVQNDLTCPIIQRLLLEPVRLISAKDGSKSQHAFENYAIKEWFNRSLTNPLNREPVEEEVVPDEHVKQKIEEVLLECFNKDLETLEAEEKEKINAAINCILLIEAVIETIKEGNLSQVKQYLDDGVDVNSKGRDGKTLLHIAAQKGHLEIVKVLLDKGADVDVKDKNGYTSLHIAAEKGNLEVVRACVEKGADINSQDKYLVTALHKAVEYGHKDIIEYIANIKSINLNPQDKEGNTPLHYAVICKRLDIVKLLIEKGCGFNIKDKLGETALNLAERQGHTGIVDILREQKKKSEELFTAVRNRDLAAVKKSFRVLWC